MAATEYLHFFRVLATAYLQLVPHASNTPSGSSTRHDIDSAAMVSWRNIAHGQNEFLTVDEFFELHWRSHPNVHLATLRALLQVIVCKRDGVIVDSVASTRVVSCSPAHCNVLPVLLCLLNQEPWHTLNLSDGVIFDGRVVDQVPQCGYQLDSSGCWFIGQYRNSRPNGSGTLIYPDGACFSGEIRDGRPFGPGYWTRQHPSDPSATVRCALRGGVPSSSVLEHDVVLSFEGGREYRGAAVQGLPQGFGTQTETRSDMKNVRRYIGDWHEGSWEGWGTLWYFDGSRYEGFFERGVSHGEGTQWFCDGSWYEGSWHNGAYLVAFFSVCFVSSSALN